MNDHTDDNDPFEEDIVFDQAGLLGGKMPRSRQQATVGFLPTFMLFIRTVFLCVAFIGLGLCSSVSGGPLIKLEMSIGVDSSLAFHTFTARAVGMLVGGLLGSVLFDIYNRQFLMLLSLVWVAVSVVVLPFSVPTALWWTFATTASLGAGLGFLFTGGNVLCLDLWGRHGGASLQALHFSFAVGAFIAPLVIQPFFIGKYPAEFTNNFTTIGGVTTRSPEASELFSRVARGATDGDVVHKITRNIVDSEVLHRVVRDVLQEEGNSTPDSVDLPTANLEDMTSKQLMELTLPQNSHDDNISTIGEIDSITTSAAVDANKNESVENITTTTAIPQRSDKPKPKPLFTNGNNLEPETETEKKWKRKQVKDNPTPIKNKENATTTANPALVNNTITSENKTIEEISKMANETGVTTTLPSEIKNTELPEITQTTTQVAPTTNTIVAITKENGDRVENKTSLPSNITSLSEHENNDSNVKVITNESNKDQATENENNKDVQTIENEKTKENSGSLTYKNETVGGIANTLEKDVISTETAEVIKNKTEVTTKKTEVITDNDEKVDININSDIYNEKFDANDNTVPEPEILEDKLPEEAEKSPSESTSDESQGIMNNIVHLLHKPGTYSNESDDTHPFINDMAHRFKDYGVTKIHLAYICIGIFMILNALISVVILCHNPREPRSKQEEGTVNEMNKTRVGLFVMMFSVFMFSAEALQGAVHHLIASGNTGDGISVIQDAGIDGQALFWGLVCVVRFLCIIISGCIRLKPGKILVSSTLFTVIGTIFLAIGSFGKGDFLWCGIVVVSLGLAPILPSSLLWMAQFMRVTHRMCALMMILSSFGNSLTHSLLTHVLGSSHLYAYILVTISCISLCFLLIAMIALYSSQPSKSLGVPVGYELASQHEEEDTIELTPSQSSVFTPRNSNAWEKRESLAWENGEAGQSLLID